jgi:hypothetical protein
LLLFTCSVAAPALAATTVKKKVVKKTVVKKKVAKKKIVKKKIVKKTVTTVRPKFPVDSGRPVAPPPAAAKAVEVRPAPAPKPAPAKSNYFIEGGLAGGSAAFELGYGQQQSDNLYLSGAAGYAIGNKFGILVLDVIRASYQFDTMFVGAGLNYAMYSALVADVPGLAPGSLPSQNMFGVELFGGMRLNQSMSVKAGWSSALGLRAAVGYEF